MRCRPRGRTTPSNRSEASAALRRRRPAKEQRIDAQRRGSLASRNTGPFNVRPFEEVNKDSAMGVSHKYAKSTERWLLARLQTQWQFGQWEALAATTIEDIEHQPERDELALLAAAGKAQQGDIETAADFVQWAERWGCARKRLLQIMMGGVHNSLGRAAALIGDMDRGQEHFEQSVSHSGIPADERLISKARQSEQLAQLGLPRLWDGANAAGGVSLRNLYLNHQGKVSDKWESYLDEYESILSGYRGKNVRLLEIGVQNGGSLEIWSHYFPKAEAIVGCDISPECGKLSYDDARIAVIVGDANTDIVEQAVIDRCSRFDIIIDDGSHQSSDIVKSFARYFPRLVRGGLYIVEDLHASYWKRFEGGLYAPYSAVTFMKRLVDIVNHEHWGVESRPSDPLAGILAKHDAQISDETLSRIHSIYFSNSLGVVRKDDPDNNALGHRMISGLDAAVWPRALDLHLSERVPYDQSSNDWTTLGCPPEELVFDARDG